MAKQDPKAEAQGRDRQQLVKLLEDQKRSGLSVAAFARKHGVPVWKLYQAHRTRRKRPGGFVEVAVDREDQVGVPLELVLPGDLRLQIPHGFDETTLRRVLGVVGSC